MGLIVSLERDLHGRLLRGVSRVPPEPLAEPLRHPQDVSPEGRAHERVQERVDAGVRQRQALGHLDGPVEGLADLAVGHEAVDDVHGAAELDHVVRQLGEQEHGHHGQQDAQGAPLPLSMHSSRPAQHPPHPAVAHHHDQERNQEPEEHLQELQGGLGRPAHAVRVDLRAGQPVLGLLHGGEDQLWQAQEARHGPQPKAHQDPALPHAGGGAGARSAGEAADEGAAAVHADARQQQHAAAEVGGVEEGGDLAGGRAQPPAVDGVDRPEGEGEEEQEVRDGEVEDAHVGQRPQAHPGGVHRHHQGVPRQAHHQSQGVDDWEEYPGEGAHGLLVANAVVVAVIVSVVEVGVFALMVIVIHGCYGDRRRKKKNENYSLTPLQCDNSGLSAQQEGGNSASFVPQRNFFCMDCLTG